MKHVVLTGSSGFLGMHTRAALLEQHTTSQRFAVGANFDIAEATAVLDGADSFIHLAGVNRGTGEQVYDGNFHFAQQAADALRSTPNPPATVVFANSIQSVNETPYGRGKAAASEILARAANSIGAEYRDIVLPNLYGEYGRPDYNSVTATFCAQLAAGHEPTVQGDKELSLLHAQDAADALITGSVDPEFNGLVSYETVSSLLNRLVSIHQIYRLGEIPDVSSRFDRNLFNTYRAYKFSHRTSIPLTRHSDARGAFFEVLRSQGGSGQTSFSTTVPGVTRGDHFHRRKIERFVVLSGQAKISLRKLFTNEILEISVDGRNPVAVDMPTMYAHNITNIGKDTLYTAFWSNELFDSSAPDTIIEVV